MVCEKCQADGERSRLYDLGPTATTDMGILSYYDEEGRHHYHNPNGFSVRWCCSRGHRFMAYSGTKCPSCDWGDEPSIRWLDGNKA